MIKIDRRLILNFDWPLFFIVIFLASIGILNLFSATYFLHSSLYLKQIYWFMISLGVMFTVIAFDYHVWERYSYLFYWISVLLLVGVLVFGQEIHGSKSWYRIGFFSFQPSELVKLTTILALAKYFHNIPIKTYKIRELIIPLILFLIPFLLILKQPDLGTALLLLLIFISVTLFVGIKFSSLLISSISAILAFPFVWFILKEHQKTRIKVFLDPNLDPLGVGYHITQSNIAVGSGKIFGKLFLRGTQSHLQFLPEQHTDFAFSVFAEEWGFIGCIVLLGVYLLLILWGLNIANRTSSKFAMIMTLGVVSLFFWHSFINIGMVIGLLPVVGVPLPFFSYGGTFMVTNMAAMGLLLNVSTRRFQFTP